MSERTRDDRGAAVLASQREYYDARAADYGDESKPADRNARGLMDAALAYGLVEEIGFTGDVLELACGTGFFTRELVRQARSLTALDASPRMIALNRERVHAPNVRYLQDDILAWKPDRQYDGVFFGFWLSHVPPTAFDRFWNLIASCLKPNRRVAFVDEDDRASSHDEPYVRDGIPSARRTLADGRQFEIVKVFWEPADLEQRLRASGWDIEVHRIGPTFLHGAGGRRTRGSG